MNSDWVEFLIGQFILEDWDLCGEYRQLIAQVGGAEIYSPRLGQSNWPNDIHYILWPGESSYWNTEFSDREFQDACVSLFEVGFILIQFA